MARRASPRRPSWVMVVREQVSAYERSVLQGMKVNSSRDVHALLWPRLCALDTEVMVVVCLDGQNNVKHLAEVSRGGAHGCAVSARDILRPAIVAAASCFVLVHNHPSGNPEPSPEDVALTVTIAAAAEIVGCPIVDHVVIGSSTRWVSFADRGML